MNDTNSNTRCPFTGKHFCCRKVSNRIIECFNKKAAEEKAKMVIDEEREQGNENSTLLVKLVLTVYAKSTGKQFSLLLKTNGLGRFEHPALSLPNMMTWLMLKLLIKLCMEAQGQ